MAFKACKSALKNLDCAVLSSDFTTGRIDARRSGSLLSYGHKIIVSVKRSATGKTKITISSSSLTIQLIDWGSNNENEEALLELISDSIL